MSFMRTALLLGAAFVLGGAQGAAAADLGDYEAMKDAVPIYQPPSPTWYFRLDGGYSAFDASDMTDSLNGTLSDTSLDDAWSLGGGVGRHFGSRFRGDLTYDHRFEADAQNYDPVALATKDFGIASDVFLANLYYDFDFGSRFTPYIGAGIGFTRNRTTGGLTVDGGTNTDVAAAAMAGVSMRLRGGQQVVDGGAKDAPIVVDSGRGLYLDAGYRFLYLGDAETGVSTLTGGTISVEDMYAHEVRLGLRYDIN